MTLLAIIGGSGLTKLKNLAVTDRIVMRTPYGEPSAPLVYGSLKGRSVVFLPRHGQGHTIPPHKINYQANLWALKEQGASHIIAVAAVGAIAADLFPGELVFPDQIIDYTYGRAHTFFGNQKQVTHVDFTFPYCEELRQVLIDAAKRAGLTLATKGTYAATQGPRFESIAEIQRLERDGAHMIGVVANAAAGKAEGVISLKQIEKNLETGMEKVRTLLECVIPLLKP